MPGIVGRILPFIGLYDLWRPREGTTPCLAEQDGRRFPVVQGCDLWRQRNITKSTGVFRNLSSSRKVCVCVGTRPEEKKKKHCTNSTDRQRDAITVRARHQHHTAHEILELPQQICHVRACMDVFWG